MAPEVGEVIAANRGRGYVFVWQIDALAEEHGLELFRRLEAAGIDVVGEQELELPEGESSFEFYLRELGAVPRLTRRREMELAAAIRSGGPEAEEAEKDLLEANLRMAAFTALRYPKPGAHVLDRVVEANNLLMETLKGYDFTRGSHFSSYATWFVRRTLKTGP